MGCRNPDIEEALVWQGVEERYIGHKAFGDVQSLWLERD
jgi:hypothetical protein